MPTSATITRNQVDWEAVRASFKLDPEYVHLGTSQYLPHIQNQ